MKKPRLTQALIRIPSSPGQPWRWRYQPAEGEPQEGQLPDDSSEHNLPAGSAEITLLLPASHILFRQVNFSGKVRRSSQQALLWQLEDFTLSDIEQLHLTLLDRQGENYALAAVDKTQLKQWLAQLSAWGLQAQRALPDILALPAESAVMLDHEWLVRSSEHEGFLATEDELPLLTISRPMCCHSPRPHALTTWQQGELQAPLALLMQGTAQNHYNLLQGEFTQRRPRAASQRPYLPLVLAGCWLLSFLVEPLLAGWQAQRHTGHLQQQSVVFYRNYFADTPPPTQTRRQLAQRITERQAGLPQPGLLTLLAQNHALLNALPEPQSLAWDGERLALTLPTPEAQLLPLLEQHRQTTVSMMTQPGADHTTLLTLARESS
ncbi:MAG TPA: type II secretion system protein GspL [Serratia grimesii]|uniref:Type II secretion system protein GspL n=1 Tax=Serratia grimesii TaxID=82995 RepID=A0A9C7V7A3_9GAMM|nr:type II secretion system protein GspL [Serratia grimesii]HCK00062.1 type II secretion system protein GspL [Serratia grimesii]